MFLLDIPVDQESSAFTNLGKKIKKLRLEKNVTQAVLAASIDVEKTNMSRIESGRTNPTLWTLLKISAALEVPVSKLLEDISI